MAEPPACRNKLEIPQFFLLTLKRQATFGKLTSEEVSGVPERWQLAEPWAQTNT